MLYAKQKTVSRDFGSRGIQYLNIGNKKKSKNRKDAQRYSRRKRYKNIKEKIKQAEDMILNRSSLDVQIKDKVILLKGLNFAPIPN